MAEPFCPPAKPDSNIEEAVEMLEHLKALYDKAAEEYKTAVMAKDRKRQNHLTTELLFYDMRLKELGY